MNLEWFLKRKNPKILIQHGRLIDPVFTFYCQNNPELKKFGWNDWTPPSPDELKRRISEYKKEWSKYEERILSDIQRLLGLSFKRNIIDVFIVSGISRATSHPIIVKSGFTPKEFVVTLAHELIHRIQAENEPNIIHKIHAVFDRFGKGESLSTKNHIVVYAALMKIFETEEGMLEIVRKDSKNIDYKKALKLAESQNEILEFYRKTLP